MKSKDVYAKIHGYDNAFTDALSSGESVEFSGIQNFGKYSFRAMIILAVIIIAECVLFYLSSTEIISYLTMVIPVILLMLLLRKMSAIGNIRDGYAVTEKRVLIYTGGTLVQTRFEDITDIVVYSVKGKSGTLEIYKKDLSEAGKTVSGGIITDIRCPEEVRSEILRLRGENTSDK
ncbi:MAG: hypothetical protein ACI4J5_02440 [Oscillospiraceae bacterium]